MTCLAHMCLPSESHCAQIMFPYKRVGVLWRCEASMKWFQGGSKANQLYPSQLWKSHKWQQALEGCVRLQGLRSFMVSPTVWAWLTLCCVLLLWTHPLFTRNRPKESSLCFLQSRSGVHILISWVSEFLLLSAASFLPLSLVPCPVP